MSELPGQGVQARLAVALLLGLGGLGFALLGGGKLQLALFAGLAVVGAALLVSPQVLLALLVGVTVLVEPAGKGALSVGALYEPLSFGPTPVEILFTTVVVATALAVTRRGLPRLPEPFVLPLLCLALGVTAGTLTGYFNDASLTEIATPLRTLAPLLALPFLVVNVVEDRRGINTVAWVVGALACGKALLGLLGLAGGWGLSEGGETITFYEPVGNWVMLLLLLVVLGGLLIKAPLPPWARWAAPLGFLALLLSYRRSFWIACALGILLVVVVGLGRDRRRLVLASVVLAGAAAWATLAAGVVTQVQAPDLDAANPVVKRLRSLEPGRVQTNRQDRYRIDERRNVLAELRHHPITGLGLGVPWRARYPLPVEHEGGRQYTHMVALWYWLKLGALGLVAYLWLMAAAVATSYRVWRDAGDRTLRALGLGLFAGLIGLAVLEMSASFTGVELRLTILVGTALGFLAAIRNHAPTASRGLREPAH